MDIDTHKEEFNWTTDDDTDDEEILCNLTQDCNISTFSDKIDFLQEQISQIKKQTTVYLDLLNKQNIIKIIEIREFLQKMKGFLQNEYKRHPWDFLIGLSGDSEFYEFIKTNIETFLQTTIISNEIFLLHKILIIYKERF